MGGSVTLRMDPPARAVGRPYLTVSQSEDGFERIMQAVELVLAWPDAGRRKSISVSIETATL
jgi:hypothetical protein